MKDQFTVLFSAIFRNFLLALPLINSVTRKIIFKCSSMFGSERKGQRKITFKIDSTVWNLVDLSLKDKKVYALFLASLTFCVGVNLSSRCTLKILCPACLQQGQSSFCFFSNSCVSSLISFSSFSSVCLDLRPIWQQVPSSLQTKDRRCCCFLQDGLEVTAKKWKRGRKKETGALLSLSSRPNKTR